MQEYTHNDMNQIIELDCEPFKVRPGDLINDVLHGLDIPTTEATTKMFGSWVWHFSEVPVEVWNKALPLLEERIRNLYYTGMIRYCRWS